MIYFHFLYCVNIKFVNNFEFIKKKDLKTNNLVIFINFEVNLSRTRDLTNTTFFDFELSNEQKIRYKLSITVSFF